MNRFVDHKFIWKMFTGDKSGETGKSFFPTDLYLICVFDGDWKECRFKTANTGFTVFVHLLYIVYAKNREPH